MKKHNLKVGQKLWLVESHHGRQKGYAGEEIEIVRAGRDWAYFGLRGGSRLRLETLHVDYEGRGSSARAYLSREAYEVERATGSAWEKMHYAVRAHYRHPDGVTIADIDQAMKLLRLAPNGEASS